MSTASVVPTATRSSDQPPAVATGAMSVVQEADPTTTTATTAARCPPRRLIGAGKDPEAPLAVDQRNGSKWAYPCLGWGTHTKWGLTGAGSGVLQNASWEVNYME
jgi:hypothetical protein